MKILYAQCGLGNQMFQYAFLKYLQSKGHDDIRIDSSAPSLHTHTGFELARIFPNVAVRNKFLPYWKGRTLHLLSDVLKKGFGLSLETEGLGEDRATIPPGKKWLRGYWQEARFAESVRKELLDDFTFLPLSDEKNLRLRDEIERSESVSIHVRGGDYVHPNARLVFGEVCTKDYYETALSKIRKMVAHPRFFVFSNDIEWTRKNLELGSDAVFVTHNTDGDSFRDMQMMSLCKHHIIANSSFSWWGAWLDDKPGCTVIAPGTWFYSYPESFSRNIIPPGWLTISRAPYFVSVFFPESAGTEDLSNLLQQGYPDFEVITPLLSTDKRVKPPGTVPSGIHRLFVMPEKLGRYNNKNELERRLTQLLSETTTQNQTDR